jgi:hypothetical protein
MAATVGARVLGGVGAATAGLLLLDPPGAVVGTGYTVLSDGVVPGHAVPDHGPDSSTPSTGDVKFGGWEGRYPAGTDKWGNTVIQSGTGPPTLQSTGEAVDPNDVTW